MSEKALYQADFSYDGPEGRLVEITVRGADPTVLSIATRAVTEVGLPEPQAPRDRLTELFSSFGEGLARGFAAMGVVRVWDRPDDADLEDEPDPENPSDPAASGDVPPGEPVQ